MCRLPGEWKGRDMYSTQRHLERGGWCPGPRLCLTTAVSLCLSEEGSALCPHGLALGLTQECQRDAWSHRCHRDACYPRNCMATAFQERYEGRVFLLQSQKNSAFGVLMHTRHLKSVASSRQNARLEHKRCANGSAYSGAELGWSASPTQGSEAERNAGTTMSGTPGCRYLTHAGLTLLPPRCGTRGLAPRHPSRTSSDTSVSQSPPLCGSWEGRNYFNEAISKRGRCKLEPQKLPLFRDGATSRL